MKQVFKKVIITFILCQFGSLLFAENADMIRVMKTTANGSVDVFYDSSGNKFGKEVKGVYTGKVRNGKCKWLTSSGVLLGEFNYVNNELIGKQRVLNPSGGIIESINKKQGKKIISNLKLYAPEGYLANEWTTKDGKIEGDYKIYNEEGLLMYIDVYKKGVKIKRKAFDEKGKIKFEQKY